ncbi:MAG: MAPEG family protein [Porticoccaceae bacterium]
MENPILASAPILAPAAVLVLWSVIILVWMVVTRFSALRKAGLSVSAAKPGTQYRDVEVTLPAKVNWKSHNYTHLMEQPTLFYAVTIILALIGEGSGLNLALAWAYVLLRVAHSLWQTLVNTLMLRIPLFALSSLCLMGLAINAVRATLL